MRTGYAVTVRQLKEIVETADKSARGNQNATILIYENDHDDLVFDLMSADAKDINENLASIANEAKNQEFRQLVEEFDVFAIRYINVSISFSVVVPREYDAEVVAEYFSEKLYVEAEKCDLNGNKAVTFDVPTWQYDNQKFYSLLQEIDQQMKQNFKPILV